MNIEEEMDMGKFSKKEARRRNERRLKKKKKIEKEQLTWDGDGENRVRLRIQKKLARRIRKNLARGAETQLRLRLIEKTHQPQKCPFQTVFGYSLQRKQCSRLFGIYAIAFDIRKIYADLGFSMKMYAYN